ncbi:MAG: DUF1810 family protein, partial [Actinobacteria bacterium]|nr:DUF1810 family protein [Actinomycetota bacterium]
LLGRPVVARANPGCIASHVHVPGNQHQLAEGVAGGKGASGYPQVDGLGFSPTSRCYAIKSIAEARAYLQHPVLGPRLVECCQAAIDVNGRSAFEIFGAPDDMKLRSCATLFSNVSAPGSVFETLLNTFFDGEPDKATLQLIDAP